MKSFNGTPALMEKQWLIGPTPEALLIEVGAEGDTLRLWRAKEAVRHGEVRIASQTANKNGLETRATSIIGWAVPVALGALTLSLNPQTAWILWPAVTVMVCFIIAAGLAAFTLLPRDWNVAGYLPYDILQSGDESELEIQERIAAEYAVGIEENKKSLKEIGRLVRLAWIAISIAPVLAALVSAYDYVLSFFSNGGDILFVRLITSALVS